MFLNKQLLDLFLEENYNNLKCYLRNRFNTLNEYDVEDIIQQTFLKLMSRNDDSQIIINISGYIYTSLRNGANDYISTSKQSFPIDVPIEIPTPSVEDEILSEELKKVIIRSIKNLDPKSRYIYIETELKNRSFDELSKETGEKIGTLLSRKSRAKQKIKKEIIKYYGRY